MKTEETNKQTRSSVYKAHGKHKGEWSEINKMNRRSTEIPGWGCCRKKINESAIIKKDKTQLYFDLILELGKLLMTKHYH